MATINELLYDKYDALVNITITNIYTLSKEEKNIVLVNFDKDNIDHIYFLTAAMTLSNMVNKPVKIKCDFFEWLKIKHKLKNKIQNFKEVKRITKVKDGIEPNSVLSFMAPAVKNYELNPDTVWGEIYNTYYGRIEKND